MKRTPLPLVCITDPAPMPTLEPRPMPALPIACPAPRAGGEQRYHLPLWRLFDKPL